MPNHESINLIEFPAKNLQTTQLFFEAVFGWQFKPLSDEYILYSNDSISIAFFQSKQTSNPRTGGALIIFYSDDLEQSMEKIDQHGGEISHPIFEYPGGRRFHFMDPNQNEYAVWSKKKCSQ